MKKLVPISARVMTVLAVGLAALAGCDAAPEAGGKLKSLEILDEKAEPLRTQFNRDAGKVRLLFILDPVCATCLRGLADLDRDLVASLSADVPVYLVHVPVIGGREKHIAGAASLIHNSNVRHYWNPSGSLGEQAGAALPLRSKGEPVYAWDVWMVYGPDAVWGDRLPQPNRLMHQLPRIDNMPGVSPLDSKAFTATVRSLVSKTNKAARP